MELSKKDEEKFYGPEGLYNKVAYIRRIISSCNSEEQLFNTEKWALKVLSDYYKIASKNLYPNFFDSYSAYMVKFANRFYDARHSIQLSISEKNKEITDA